MADTSPHLSLPFIAPAQAQKHVTHNEALQRLDVLAQLRVQEFDAITPPAVPVEGEVYATGQAATGNWAGQDQTLAAYYNGAWLFIAPKEGWLATDATNGEARVWQTGAWVAVVIDLNNLDGVGIGGATDTTNRLVVTSPAALFTHEGGGHQIKLNKASPTDTGTLLFQTGYSGLAEMGLAGSDAWSLKVSETGSNWTEAVYVDPSNGNVGMGTNTPQYPLHIHRPNGNGASVLLSNGTTGNGPTDGFWFGYSNKAYFWNYEATDTQFATSNTARVTITAAGRVGIGTAAPTCALDVTGPVRPGNFASGARPDAGTVGAGACIYDTTLSLPLWSDGTVWRDAAGAAA